MSLACLIFFYIVAEEIGDRETLWLRAVGGSIAFTAIMLAGAIRMIFVEAPAIWTALFWFRVSSAVYLGLGNLSPFLVAAEFRLYMEDFFQFSDRDIAQLNLLFASSAFFVLLASTLFLATSRKLLHASPQQTDRPQVMLEIAILFFVIGAPIKYLLVVPTMLKLLDYVVPSSLGQIGNFTIPGLFLLTAFSLEHNRRLLPVSILVLALEMAIGLLAMTKEGVLTPLIIFVLALMRRRVTVALLAATVASIVAVFLAIIPVVIDGRIELGKRYGTDLKASLDERVEVLYRAVTGDLRAAAFDTSASAIALVRISYVNQAGFAMYLYN